MNNTNVIFAGVDGTGEWSDSSYEITFKNSHVNTLFKYWAHGPSNYLRGPYRVDEKVNCNTWLQAKRTFDFVVEEWELGSKAVFLAGYSRGAAAVIEVAKWLKGKNIPVDCLILFDPVDRSPWVGEVWRDTPIVDTVKTVIKALRDIEGTQSRESFGSCGKDLENAQLTRLLPHAPFFATHGGLGGTPWTYPAQGFINEGFPDNETKVTISRDKIGSQMVKDWAFGLVSACLTETKQRLTQPVGSVPPFGSAPPFGSVVPKIPIIPLPGSSPKVHIVKPGDWLSKIAQTYYGDVNKWMVIYNANKAVIGNNPNLILPGMKLIIP